MKHYTWLLLPFLLVATLAAFGQTKMPAQPELESGTIESQFNYIIEKSSSFKDFQLIRKASILKVKSNALDSLIGIRKELATTKTKIAPLQQKITTLENEVTTLKSEIAALTEEKDSMSFFGNNMDKGAYNTMMWGIVIVLLIGLFFFVIRFKSSNATTKKIKYELEKIEGEYEAFRKKALKKEQEIMRKLQDEINKNTP